ncbi:MAG: flavodoxin family protein [Clostridium sp.]|uniref:flavodoxin family protein n=1 Tax=Clostridium sp. TaxID=1506 RepID=UPI003D6CB4A0
MKYKVVYFTRSGNSKRVAEKIAIKLSCELIEITDNMNWKGILGFIKGGYYASRNKVVDIKVNGDLTNTDELIVVSPMWAGTVAPSINTFFKTTTLTKVHLVVTSGGSALKSRSGFKSVSDIIKNKKNEDAIINDLVNRLL